MYMKSNIIKYIIKINIRGLYKKAVTNFNLKIFIIHLVAPQLGQSMLNFSFIEQFGTKLINLVLHV